jgi:hypothetical protein
MALVGPVSHPVWPVPTGSGCPVGAENLCHLGVCAEEAVRVNARTWRLVAGLHAGGRAMIFGLWA